MKLLVTGPGHSGGNWVTEIARATGKFNFTEEVEDRTFFFTPHLPDSYATKLATDNLGFYWENIYKMMACNEDLYIIFTTRHPIDNCLSKIARGVPKEGNEPVPNLLVYSWEATLNGAIKSIEIAYSLYSILEKVFPERVLRVRLEDLIKGTEGATLQVCKFLDVPYKEEYCEAYKNTRNTWQKIRYQGKKDVSQVNMYKRLGEIYDGMFVGEQKMVDFFKTHLNHIILSWEYDI